MRVRVDGEEKENFRGIFQTPKRGERRAERIRVKHWLNCVDCAHLLSVEEVDRPSTVSVELDIYCVVQGVCTVEAR